MTETPWPPPPYCSYHRHLKCLPGCDYFETGGDCIRTPSAIDTALRRIAAIAIVASIATSILTVIIWEAGRHL